MKQEAEEFLVEVTLGAEDPCACNKKISKVQLPSGVRFEAGTEFPVLDKSILVEI